MCWSTATLLYGIWVTTASLEFAATAHSRIQPVSRAIDLILLRRRLGTLEVEKDRCGVDELPSEVWEMIKKELLPLELDRAEREALRRLRCEACEEDDVARAVAAGKLGKDDDPKDVEIEHTWDRWQPPECDWCWRGCNLGIDWDPRRAEIARVLASYGLCTPDNMWTSEEDEENDFNSAVSISLPFRTIKSRSPACSEAQTDHHYRTSSRDPSVSALSNFLPSVFALPLNADRRFAALVKDWKLDIVDKGGSQVIQSPYPFNPVVPHYYHATHEEEKQEEDELAPKEEVLMPSEPRWMMWNWVTPCLPD